MIRTSAPLAASALAAGFLTVSVPAAQAAPGDCLDWTFNGATVVNITGQANMTVNFTSTGKTASGPSKITGLMLVDTADGTISGGINGTGITLKFSSPALNGKTLDMTGAIGPDGIARGQTTGEFSGGDWTSGQLHCSKKEEAPEAPKTKSQPTVTGEAIVGGVVVHVKDNSGETAQCQYDSEIFDRAFTLPANTTVDLKFVPAVPLFKTWNVSVTCDNGTSTTANIFF